MTVMASALAAKLRKLEDIATPPSRHYLGYIRFNDEDSKMRELERLEREEGFRRDVDVAILLVQFEL
jgi:hypothetical protein